MDHLQRGLHWESGHGEVGVGRYFYLMSPVWCQLSVQGCGFKATVSLRPIDCRHASRHSFGAFVRFSELGGYIVMNVVYEILIPFQSALQSTILSSSSF